MPKAQITLVENVTITMTIEVDTDDEAIETLTSEQLKDRFEPIFMDRAASCGFESTTHSSEATAEIVG